MNKIAFKRAKNCPAVKNSLHPEFICEYTDTSLFPEGFHKEEDGYEFLEQEVFDLDFAQNEQRKQDFLAEKHQAEMLKREQETAARLAKVEEEEKLRQEYEEFKAWKALKEE